MQIGWIDFSKEERNKVLSVIHLLEEPEAVDELGLGAVRDAFADYFFPGTSTVQTRAKYFVIVPYILREAASGEYGSNAIEVIRRIDQEECNCRNLLLKTSSDGVIGKRVADSWVQRTPASIYWNGLKKLGILTSNVSLREFVQLSLNQRMMKNDRDYGNREKDAPENEKDDNDAGDITSIRFLNLGGIYDKKWRDGLSIELTKIEADFLKTQIIQNQSSTLLAYLVMNGIYLEKYETFSALSSFIKNSVTEELADMIKLANDINKLVLLITTRYNLIISAGKNKAARERWNTISQNLNNYASVDLKRVFTNLPIKNSKLITFLFRVQESVIKDDIEFVDKLIISREVQKKDGAIILPENIDLGSYISDYSKTHKKSRAKTMQAGNKFVEGWTGIDIFDYRYTPTRRIVNDILKAEGVDNV